MEESFFSLWGGRCLEALSNMKKRLFTFLLFIALLAIELSPVWCRKVIDTATLTITLTVLAPPITEETPVGDYTGYEVAKSSDTIFVTAV